MKEQTLMTRLYFMLPSLGLLAHCPTVPHRWDILVHSHATGWRLSCIDTQVWSCIGSESHRGKPCNFIYHCSGNTRFSGFYDEVLHWWHLFYYFLNINDSGISWHIIMKFLILMINFGLFVCGDKILEYQLLQFCKRDSHKPTIEQRGKPLANLWDWWRNLPC